ncbi:glycosyltransferase [Aporhodopirellula aestuarii]|uniref:Glycosyltransferase n=1 Tax=Aporhodopirellula aestuarii TaxID=2950107 RepID=A0ABT0UDG3_9BACT|nr:glycosyltransferase [Aporhodopirellula aestuarii]MCM2374826.1 glycosyltransferase [Aporhodopirellula aestuarii]
MMRRVLFISYAYPPTGGGGVQRSVKFTKYLPQFGWQPTVLTVANPSVPVHDDTLVRDIDPAVEIIRARTWEPSYRWKQHLSGGAVSSDSNSGDRKEKTSSWRRSLKRWTRLQAMSWLQPDPQVLWNRSAYRMASGALRKQPHDAIFVTGPPFSSFLLACRLKRAFGLPLVVDFRDEWMLACRYLDNHQQSGKAANDQRTMMLDVLACADAVVATTQASAAELSQHCLEVQSRARVSCIHNGFDPSDFPDVGSSTEVASERFRLVYTGTLWRLTDISPLVDAIVRLHVQDPDLVSRLDLVLAGRRTPEQDAVLKRLERTTVSVVRHDYLPHDEALKLAAGADGLLLLLSGDTGAERVVPAKLFEYLTLQRPILAICPQGETRDLLSKYSSVRGLGNNDIQGISDWLTKRIRGSECEEPISNHKDVLRFSRVALTERLSELLSNCVSVQRKAA